MLKLNVVFVSVLSRWDVQDRQRRRVERDGVFPWCVCWVLIACGRKTFDVIHAFSLNEYLTGSVLEITPLCILSTGSEACERRWKAVSCLRNESYIIGSTLGMILTKKKQYRSAIWTSAGTTVLLYWDKSCPIRFENTTDFSGNNTRWPS